MAELRTIQRTEIRDFTRYPFLLWLNDQFSVIPYPIRSLGFNPSGHDHCVLVVGPTGLFLISCHLLVPRTQQPHYQDLTEDLERAAEMLWGYLSRYCNFLPPFELIMAVQDGNIQGFATQRVHFMGQSKIRTWLAERPVLLSEEQVHFILRTLNAEQRFERIDRYQIIHELQRDPHQSTYLAIHTVEGRQVILKQIPLPRNAQAEVHTAVIRGAKLAKELHHENIVQVEKILTLETRVLVVTEWCEGSVTLRQYLREHPGSIPLSTAIQLMRDLCQALMYAHAQGIIHRNLSPDNMLVTADHRLKVFNFDLAKKPGMHTLKTSEMQRLTEENPYAAPEYIFGGGHQVDQRVDVFSVGIIFYELLTGRPQMHYMHYDESRWVPPSRLISGLPAYMDSLIAKAIRFDPNQRYTTIHAFYNALEKGTSDLVGARYRLLDPEYHKQTENSLIFRAEDTHTHQRVALKKLLIPPITDYQTHRALLQERLEPLKPLRHLSHPSLVAVYDTLLDDDDAYVVMEWLEGRTLREIQQSHATRGTYSPEAVRQMAVQLAAVLRFIHGEGYFHGDIKPENIMVSSSGKVTLLDFEPRPKQLDAAQEAVPLTLRYMAPELFNSGVAPNEQTDLFALGVVLFELLTHNYPYDLAPLREASLEAPPVPRSIRVLRPEVPEDLERLLLRMVAFRPSERLRSFAQLLDQLEGEQPSEQHPFEALRMPLMPEIAQESFTRIPWPKLSALTVAVILGGYLLWTLPARILPPPIPILEETTYE